MTKSPLVWVGGKFYLAQKLIKMFPDHTTYVEVFGGAGHVLFQKDPSPVEIYNDLDDRLVNFYRVVQDREKLKELQKKLSTALYARSIFDKCREEIQNGHLTDIEKAYCFFILNRQSFGGKMGTWGVDVSACKQAKSFYNAANNLDPVAFRLKFVQIENDHFEKVIKRYDRQETFFYLDPPYVFGDVRGKDKVYKHEMTDGQHETLVDILLGIKGKAMLSGYNNPIYSRLVDNGWERVLVGESNIALQKVSGAGRLKKEEYVWINY